MDAEICSSKLARSSLESNWRFCLELSANITYCFAEKWSTNVLTLTCVQAYTGSDTELHEFQQFMGICVYAKDHNHQRTLTVLQSLVNATRRSILRNVDKISKVIIGEKNQMNVPVLSTPQERLGKW